jgi:hypothetical protein
MVEGHAEVDILSAGQEVAFLLYERRISGVAWCNSGATQVPKHGNNGRSGQKHTQIWDCMDAVPLYVLGGHYLLNLRIRKLRVRRSAGAPCFMIICRLCVLLRCTQDKGIAPGVFVYRDWILDIWKIDLRCIKVM